MSKSRAKNLARQPELGEEIPETERRGAVLALSHSQLLRVRTRTTTLAVLPESSPAGSPVWADR